MQPRYKFIASVAIVVAGVASAWLFRRPAPVTDNPASAAHALERRSQDTGAPAAEVGHLLGHIEPVEGDGITDVSVPDHSAPAQPLPKPVATAAGHEAIPRSLPAANPTPAPVASADMPSDSPWSAAGTRTSVLPTAVTGTTSVDAGQFASARSGKIAYKKHRVADGDTLSSLAQHYLRDGSRWAEIFELNRDVLRDPDILPIGARIKIPDARSAPPAQAALPRGPQASLASDRTVSLVDLPLATSPATVAPLVPIRQDDYLAARASGRKGTYRVQPRDTLVSIARQFYGDERRYQEIYDANRAQIPDPNNLPAGVLLNIP